MSRRRVYKVRYGKSRSSEFSLYLSPDLITVRSEQSPMVTDAVRSMQGIRLVDSLRSRAAFPRSLVSVLQIPVSTKSRRESALSILKQEKQLRFAGRALCDRISKSPVVYTENAFIKFRSDLSATKCRACIREFGLKKKREIHYGKNSWFVEFPENTGRDLFDRAIEIGGDERVLHCYPEILREVRPRSAFPEQWHLKKTRIANRSINAHVNVEAAWEIATGKDVIVAVIDDGVDYGHEEFTGNGKIVKPRDTERGLDSAKPFRTSNNHGTACAGVACANGKHGAAGVAPDAKLMPIRVGNDLGAIHRDDAFVWAAENGARVISCSWGSPDGNWTNPDDPAHLQEHPLPPNTRDAIDFATEQGCIVVFAAGNGNESVDLDGYASYENVIAVAACNDQGKRCPYSDFGKAICCSFPSNDPTSDRTKGIWTTDRTGADLGYNPLETGGDPDGKYTDAFRGTSSACPGVAGVIALMLEVKPSLRLPDVRALLKQSCKQIDLDGGDYDDTGHSPFYGFGRVDALKAAAAASNHP